MAQIITVLYENGILRPLTPLNLREQQRVQIQILPPETPEAISDELETRICQMRIKGWIRPRPSGPIPPPPISEEALQVLAERLGRTPGKTASEMVIEDRGD